MTDEEYLRNRLDRLNQNSHYGIMIDTEITDIVRSHIKRLEETKMNATSTEEFKDIIAIDFELQTFPNPDVQDKFIVSATNRDDIFAFVFEGPNIVDTCRKTGLFTGWEKDQKIRELEKENENLKKHVQYHIDNNGKLMKRIYELKQEQALEKAANEAQHKFIREYAGKGTEVQFNYAIDDAKEVSYVIVDRKENERIKENLQSQHKMIVELNKANCENCADEEAGDNVNHPSHYTGRYECIDVMQDVFGDEATNDFCLCNAFKYIWRARKKNGLEDVKKAVWYLNKYIEEAEKDGVPKGK